MIIVIFLIEDCPKAETEETALLSANNAKQTKERFKCKCKKEKRSHYYRDAKHSTDLSLRDFSSLGTGTQLEDGSGTLRRFG